jgi:hypothetical protein
LPASARDGGHITVVDLKTTGGSGHPDDWQRTAFDMGYDFQDAHYKRGLLHLLPNVRSVRFVFAVLEQDAPYGLALNEFGGQAAAEARILMELARDLWGACLQRNEWPGYPPETTHIDPPKWRSERAEIRRLAMLRRAERWQGIGATRQPDAITTTAAELRSYVYARQGKMVFVAKGFRLHSAGRRRQGRFRPYLGRRKGRDARPPRGSSPLV